MEGKEKESESVVELGQESHSSNEDTPSSPSSPSSPQPNQKVQKGPSRRCRHWARGLCKLGSTCTFLHTGVAGVHVPCRHFVRTGSCSRGDLCDFKHEPTGYGVGLYGVPRDVMKALEAQAAVGFPPGYLGGPGPGGLGPRPVLTAPLFAPPPPQLLPESVMRPLVAPFAGPLNGPMQPPQVAATRLFVAEQKSSARCRHWENGSCRLGKNCGFHHDPSVVQVDPKYRTKVCRHWEKGNCRLGESCSFAHSKNP